MNGGRREAGILDTRVVISLEWRPTFEPLRARTSDAMIAIANDLPLYAYNPDDFSRIDESRVVAAPVRRGRFSPEN